MVAGHEPIFDLFVFLAYISIPLEILIFGIFLRKKLFKGEMTLPKLIVLAVGILFVSFILCCGITHLLGFMSGVICHGQEIPNKSPFCEGMGQGPLSGYVYSWKLITAVVSCITAFALGLLMKPILEFVNVFTMLSSETSGNMQSVEDCLRMMLSSVDCYSVHDTRLRFESISNSGQWLCVALCKTRKELKCLSLLDVIHGDDVQAVQDVVSVVCDRMYTVNSFDTLDEESMMDSPMERLVESPSPYSRSRDVSARKKGAWKTSWGSSRSGESKEFRLRAKAYTVEYRLNVETESGEPIWVESRFLLDDATSKIHCVTRDIGSRRQQERERSAMAQAEASKETVQRWLHYMSCVAHDLKTPLTCFEMAIEEIAADKDIGEDSQQALAHARASCGVLRGTVSQAIDVRSSVSAGYMPTPRMIEVSFIEMWGTIKGMCPALSINPNVKVVFEVSRNVPSTVLTDGGWLMQMTLNLVSNSCKYTLDGSVTVRCLALETGLESDKPVVRVEVRDTGVGMRPDAAAKLFQPFYQAQKGQGTGTGLGLYSVRLHSEALGGVCGWLPAPADQGRGSIFYYEVPLIQVDEEPLSFDVLEHQGVYLSEEEATVSVYGQQASPEAETADLEPTQKNNKVKELQAKIAARLAAKAAVSDRGKKEGAAVKDSASHALVETPEVMNVRHNIKKMLVVDDVGSIRKLLPAKLKRLAPDTEIVTAENGQQALTMVTETWDYDLCITDVVMPVMSGPEWVTRLREAEHKGRRVRTPVVGMSANTSPEDVRQYLQGGMDAFMMKPMPSVQQEVAIICMSALESAHRHTAAKRTQNLDMFNAMTFERRAFDLQHSSKRQLKSKGKNLLASTFDLGSSGLPSKTFDLHPESHNKAHHSISPRGGSSRRVSSEDNHGGSPVLRAKSSRSESSIWKQLSFVGRGSQPSSLNQSLLSENFDIQEEAEFQHKENGNAEEGTRLLLNRIESLIDNNRSSTCSSPPSAAMSKDSRRASSKHPSNGTQDSTDFCELYSAAKDAAPLDGSTPFRL